MKNVTQLLKATGIIAVSTLILIVTSNFLSLGAFGVTSLLGCAGLALGLTAAAHVLFYCLAAPICIPLGLQQPGTLLQTVFGIAAGSLAIWLVGLLVPGTVLLGGLLAAIPYALANTAMIWLLAYITGSLRADLTLLPKRK